MKDFEIYRSLDGVTYELALAGTLGMATPGQMTGAQSFGLSDIEAQYMRIDILSNHGAREFSGLSEVKFTGEALASVPEPTTLLLFGTGLLGLVSLRRKMMS